jgi:two-component system response regulator FixJ
MPESHRPVVIVVDDDDAVRESLRFFLETAGFDVDAFASARDFLAAASKDSPLCMLIDQHMPQLTGLDLIRALRDRGVNFSAALMTGSPSPELASRAHALGVDDVLEKPLSDDSLIRFVTATFGRA